MSTRSGCTSSTWNLGLRFGRPLAASAAVLALGAGLVAPAAADAGIAELATPSLRSPIAADSFYFVMTDRYRDGDPANNRGGRSGGSDATGFDPTSNGYYHGGDLAGLTGRCDPSDPADDGLARIKRLGFTAVWITPPFVQRTVQGSSAAYHGYWFLDLTRPDPHLGTEAEFAAFMACAKSLGLKVFLDVVVNHTADVISYPEGNAYVPIGRAPYRTAAGRVFNPGAYTAGAAFPRLSARRSFAKTPTVPAQLRGVKAPAVLNEVTRYHNRGDIAWGSCTGRCEMDGDFYGLDDLMTEDWTIVRALADAYGDWITRYGVDGFRLDTAKHVDPAFFGRWLPLVQQKATAAGKPSFTSFGEVWYTDAAQLSEMMLARQLPSVLDFPFQQAAKDFVTGKASGASLTALFEEDDYYTSPTTNAYGLTTFLGNHDMGRIGFFLTTETQAQGRPLLERALLAHDLLYLTRGVPVVYYGDEVGMTGSGDGTDKNARQDMFPTQVPEWQREERIGTPPVGTGSSFDESTAIEDRVTRLSALRAKFPALAGGAMIPRFGKDSLFAASRFDAQDLREYVVAFNSADTVATALVPTSTPNSSWTRLLEGAPVRSDAAGLIPISVPPRSSVVLQAVARVPQPGVPSVSVRAVKDFVTGRYRLTAAVPGADPSTVTFVMRRPGGAWRAVGTDDARPFRVFLPPGRGSVEVSAVVTTTVGQQASASPLRVKIAPFL